MRPMRPPAGVTPRSGGHRCSLSRRIGRAFQHSRQTQRFTLFERSRDWLPGRLKIEDRYEPDRKRLPGIR